MLLGFKRRFAPFVEDGSKTHTIRATRKNPPRVGDTCHCYVDPRQKSMRLLGRWKCVKVERIEIFERESSTNGVAVFVDGVGLDHDEKNALAWRDGFRSRGPNRAFQEMTEFWSAVHGKIGYPLAFKGYIIHWRYEEKPAATTRQPRRARRAAVGAAPQIHTSGSSIDFVQKGETA